MTVSEYTQQGRWLQDHATISCYCVLNHSSWCKPNLKPSHGQCLQSDDVTHGRRAAPPGESPRLCGCWNLHDYGDLSPLQPWLTALAYARSKSKRIYSSSPVRSLDVCENRIFYLVPTSPNFPLEVIRCWWNKNFSLWVEDRYFYST